ncbi:hypothetical protein D5281_16280 [bacterium 1xD42-62]|uniref:Uncharacterized protein n=1 Tax=Parablautia muri TaxID=2320879 RepID=A0A9X5BHL6_9FIRM|nr:hypothetical protein [Parablautia muri]
MLLWKGTIFKKQKRSPANEQSLDRMFSGSQKRAECNQGGKEFISATAYCQQVYTSTGRRTGCDSFYL